MEDKSIALSIVEDYKRSNKRKDIMIFFLIAIIGLFVGGLIYVITNYDFSYEETYAETDADNACVGDNCDNGDEYYGESIQ